MLCPGVFVFDGIQASVSTNGFIIVHKVYAWGIGVPPMMMFGIDFGRTLWRAFSWGVQARQVCHWEGDRRNQSAISSRFWVGLNTSSCQWRCWGGFRAWAQKESVELRGRNNIIRKFVPLRYTPGIEKRVLVGSIVPKNWYLYLWPLVLRRGLTSWKGGTVTRPCEILNMRHMHWW